MITEADLMQALVDELQSVPELIPSDVTIDRLKVAAGCTRRQAEVMLMGKVDRGELVIVKRYNPESRRVVNAYRNASLIAQGDDKRV